MRNKNFPCTLLSQVQLGQVEAIPPRGKASFRWVNCQNIYCSGLKSFELAKKQAGGENLVQICWVELESHPSPEQPGYATACSVDIELGRQNINR